MTEEQSKIPSSLPDLHQPGKSVQRRMRAVSDTEKQELLMKLLEIWKSRPQLRLGQLLASPYLDASTFRFRGVEDETLIGDLERLYT